MHAFTVDGLAWNLVLVADRTLLSVSLKYKVHLVIPKGCVCGQKKSTMAKKNVLIFHAAYCSVNTFSSTKRRNNELVLFDRADFDFL